MKNVKFLHLVLILCVIFFFSCKKNNSSSPSATVVKQWTVPMSATYEAPAPAGRSETGTATLTLYADNSFKYDVKINNLKSGDAIVAGHLHYGDPVTSGPIILPLNPTFVYGSASGTVMIPRSTLVDSIKNGTVYINFHSTQVPTGLIRGQLDKTIDFATDVAMIGANENPPVTTTATGTAYLRLTTDKTLYSKVVVQNLEAGDTFTASHVHKGAVGVNGSIIINLALSLPDFGITKINILDDPTIASLKNDAVYVNAHTVNHPSGIIRGQIR